jgi:hypothetical protein
MTNNDDLKIKNIIDIFKLNQEDYSEVMRLEELIQNIFKVNSFIENNCKDFDFSSEAFNIFISKTIVCFNNLKNYTFFDFLADIGQLENVTLQNIDLITFLDNCVLELDSDENYLPGKYEFIQKMNRPKDKKNVSTKNFTYHLVNTRNFEILRLILGDNILSFLFKYTSIFIYDEKINNYIQITGIDLTNKLFDIMGVSTMKQYSNSLTSSSLFSKSYKGNREIRDRYVPNPVFVVERTKIYYCPNFNRKLGLHKNSLKNPKNREENQVDYLYNRMFGVYGNIVPNGCCSDTKSMIKTILEKTKTFSYHSNIFRCCPIRVSKDIKSNTMESIRKNDTQKLNEYLLDLIKVENTVKYHEVHRFVSVFLSEVIPINMVGKDNFAIILEKLKVLIKMNRYETLNRISLFELREFSFKNMDVLRNFHMTEKSYYSFGVKLKNFIMKSIIYWIFDILVVQLIRSHFYVTEKQGDHYKTFYYHKKDWDLVMKINQKKLESQFKPINAKDAKEELMTYDLAFGRLRLMPKSSTCRPIISYKKKTMKSRVHLKTYFYEAQKVFKHISNKMQNNSENCVVFDYKNIIRRLLHYKDVLGEEHVDISYHTLDIEACYDNIDINKLIGFLDNDDIISENFVSNVLFLVLPKVANKKNATFKECFEIKKLFFVSEVSEYINFLDYLKNKNDLNYTNCLLYHTFDKYTSSYVSKMKIIPMIKNILNCNIIRFNKKCFRQVKGIPQGLSISSFLCNLYFYNIERNLSKKITRILTEKNLLMRFMDDYILMSASTDRISSFVDEQIKVSNDNKFNFNMSKSSSNYDVAKHEKKVADIDEVNWNGITFRINRENKFNMFIDSKDEYDLDRFGTVININLPLQRGDYEWMIKKISSILLTGHPWIYFISSLNNRNTLEKNFKDFTKVVLYKLVIFTRILWKYKLLPGQKVFNDILKRCLKKFYFYINNKLGNAEGKKFFIDDFVKFVDTFYINMFELYRCNKILISKSVFLYKCVRRRILKYNNC